jgi:hypothetical protein
MQGLFFLETRKKRFSFAALFALTFAIGLNAQAPATQSPSADADHLPPVSSKVSSLTASSPPGSAQTPSEATASSHGTSRSTTPCNRQTPARQSPSPAQ